MKQSEVNALLAARGQKNLTGATLRHAQAQARLDLLYSRSQDAQGAYAKQSDSLFVQQKNLAASFENLKASLGASLTQPLANLLNSMLPLVDMLGKSLAPAFEMLGRFIGKLAPLFAPLLEVLLVLYDAFTPILDVLLAIIEPLLVPLIEIFKLLVMIIKPLIPLITFLARVIGAILVPVVVVLSVALTLVIKILQKIFEAFAAIPGVGDAFKGMNEGLKGFMDGFGGVMDKIGGVNNSTDEMTAKLSKKLPIPDVNGTNTALGKVGEGAKKASERMTDLLKNALEIQKNIMDSANITGVLDQTSSDIVESVVYLDGKFKTVISGIKNNSTDLVGAFQGSLTKIKTFYTNLNELLKAKLDPALIEQITSAGPDAGNATAEAILASGKTGIKSLNKTFRDIKKVSGDIGAKVALTMEKTGADIGNGLIDGIKAQADRLNTLATSMGKGFGSAFSDAIPDGMGNTGNGDAASPSATPTGMTPYAFPKGIKASDYGIYLKAFQIKNPYDKASSPAQYKRFSEALSTANQYNIAINVAPGATNADIGRHLVSAIQTYERKNGKQF
jgi:phage-related protein